MGITSRESPEVSAARALGMGSPEFCFQVGEEDGKKAQSVLGQVSSVGVLIDKSARQDPNFFTVDGVISYRLGYAKGLRDFLIEHVIDLSRLGLDGFDLRILRSEFAWSGYMVGLIRERLNPGVDYYPKTWHGTKVGLVVGVAKDHQRVLTLSEIPSTVAEYNEIIEAFRPRTRIGRP